MAERPTGFGELVRRHRIASGLTQEQLAERIELSVRAISDIERGRTARPHRNSVSLLAHALGLPRALVQEFTSAAGAEGDARAAAPHEQPAPQASAAARPATAPRQLPGSGACFVGRAAELAALNRLLPRTGATPGTVVISAIAGPAGIGKTALALHWAHLVADEFPDGQLYVNLRGFDQSAQPVPPATAIRGFLDALGITKEQIPAGLDAQAGLYRGLLAGRRMLIVLDNAQDADQVRPLLPASSACLVVVTSRNQLAGLVAVDGAHLLALDLLTEAEAAELLSRRLGADRLAAEREAAGELIRLCARLPLALCIAAARAATHPHFPLAALAAELGDTARRLDALAIGEESTSLSAVFSWSYQQLSAPAARMFRMLSLHPGPDITAAAAASLAGTTAIAARRALQELSRSSMLGEDRPGRFAFHDLLRVYAADLAATRDSPKQRLAATERVLDHYLHTARNTEVVLYPRREETTVAPPRPGVLPEHIAGYEQAMAWFEAEHRVLIAAIGQAADTGLDTYAWQLPLALTEFLYLRGHWDSYLSVQQTALAAAMRLGDRQAQAVVHRHLGVALYRLGSYQEAHSHCLQALDLFRQLGDSIGEGRVHNTLGSLFGGQGRYSESLDHSLQALRLFQAGGDRALQAIVLNNIGYCLAKQGNNRQALDYCQQAMALHEELGQRHGQAYAADSLGLAHQQLGNYDQAIGYFRHAAALFRDLGDRHLEATVLINLGDAELAAARSQAARETWQQALAILDDLNHADADRVRAKLRAGGAAGSCQPEGRAGPGVMRAAGR